MSTGSTTFMIEKAASPGLDSGSARSLAYTILPLRSTLTKVAPRLDPFTHVTPHASSPSEISCRKKSSDSPAKVLLI